MDTMNKMNINWYPGHMAKAFREIDNYIKYVDCVLVLLDARIPKSSFNPEIINKCQNKKILFVFTKSDLSEANILKKWMDYYKTLGDVISVNLKNPKSKEQLTKAIIETQKEKRAKDALKGLRPKAIKVMVLGIPNVGKSTLINALVGKKIASVGNKPGVTKAQQWVKINENFELLDTPGVLWPKFENETVGLNLALTGSIKDDILPLEDVVKYGMSLMNRLYPGRLNKRYEVEEDDMETYLDRLIKHKNIYNQGKPNINRCCMMFLNDLRSGLLGEVVLDEQ